MSQEEAIAEEYEWGTLLTYYQDAETYGTRGILVAVAVIKPGHEIHPPHQHAEEEFMMVMEGKGVMYVGEERIPTRKGDLLYTSPLGLARHQDTGTEPLTFVVFKWNYKGVPPPLKPSEDGK